MRMTSEQWWVYTQLMGEKLSYPQCCITAFCNGRIALDCCDETFFLMSKQGGPYFVPCPDHEQAILNGTSVKTILGRDLDMDGPELKTLCNNTMKLVKETIK